MPPKAPENVTDKEKVHARTINAAITKPAHRAFPILNMTGKSIEELQATAERENFIGVKPPSAKDDYNAAIKKRYAVRQANFNARIAAGWNPGPALFQNELQPAAEGNNNGTLPAQPANPQNIFHTNAVAQQANTTVIPQAANPNNNNNNNNNASTSRPTTPSSFVEMVETTKNHNHTK